MPNRTKKLTELFLSLFGALLMASVLAKWMAGYITRRWEKNCKNRGISVEVQAPGYGPAMVVSTDEFLDEDPIFFGGDEGYHTKTLRLVTKFHLVKKIAVVGSLISLAVATVLFFTSKD